MKITRLLIGSVLALAASCWSGFAPVVRASYAWASHARQLLTSLPEAASAVFKATLAEWRSMNALDAGPDMRGLQALSNHFVQFGALKQAESLAYPVKA